MTRRATCLSILAVVLSLTAGCAVAPGGDTAATRVQERPSSRPVSASPTVPTTAPSDVVIPVPTTGPTTSPTPQSGGGLDPSGATVPLTNYAIPPGAIVMSPTGNDINSGTLDAPVKSLGRAISLAPAGGTIVMRGGEHRESYMDSNRVIRHVNKSLTIQAYPGEQPWFNGTDVVVDGWTRSGNTWSRPWSTPHFCGGAYDVAIDGQSPVSPFLPRNSPCGFADSLRDTAYPVAGDPQLAFVNGAQMLQKGNLAELAPGSRTFYYDWSAKRIHVSEDPTTNVVELASRTGVAVLGGPFDFVVRGVGFHRYASSLMGNTTASVLYIGLGGAGTPTKGRAVLENVVFSENAGTTLSISGPKNGTVVRSSVFANNHYGGMHADGFANSNPGAPNDLLLEGNIFNANNQGNIDSKCSASCGAANVKLTHMAGFVVRNNVFENALTRSHGFWCDMDCSNGVIVGNTVRNNDGHGIFYEISNRGIIANNLVYHNGGTGIVVCAANTKVYNNTIVNKPGPRVQAVWIWDDDRVAPGPQVAWPYVNPRVDLGPNTTNVEFANNVIVAQQPLGARLMNFGTVSDTAPNTPSSQYFSVLDNNIYYHLSGQNLYAWHRTDAIRSAEQLRSVSGQAWEQSTISVVGSGDPFVNRAAEDFRFRSDSLARTSPGRSLPPDVAAAMGVNGPVARGALR